MIALFLLDISSFTQRHPGLVLVLFGVAGEGLEILVKLRFKFRSAHVPAKVDLALDLFGAGFWVILLIGLCLEFGEAAKSDTDVATANNSAAKATLGAAEANERAAKAEQRIVQSETRVEELRLTNLIFEKQILVLKQQILETSANVAKTDATRRPVASITVDVRLTPDTVNGGDPSHWDFTASLSVRCSTNPASLVAFYPVTPQKMIRPDLPPVYVLHFSSPFRPVQLMVNAPLMPGQSAFEAADSLDSVSITVTNSTIKELSIVDGHITVIVNDAVRKDLVIDNDQKIMHRNGTLTGHSLPNRPARILAPPFPPAPPIVSPQP